MFGIAFWVLWTVGFALYAANMGRRLLAMSGLYSSMPGPVQATVLYIAVAGFGVGLGVVRLLTTDQASFVSLNYFGLSLAALAVDVVLLIRFFRVEQSYRYLRVYALVRAKRYAEALSTTERVLARRPALASFWHLKAMALLSLDQPSAALDASDQALALLAHHQGRRTARRQRATLLAFKAGPLVLLHREGDALTACEDALALVPMTSTAWAYKAAVLQRTGHPEEALATAQLVLDDRRLQTTSAWHSFALSTVAAALNALGRYEAALDAVEHSIKLAPDRDRSWVKLRQAVAFAGLGRLTEAQAVAEEGLAAAERRVAERPHSIDAWESRAALLRWLGRASEADEAETHAHALLP